MVKAVVGEETQLKLAEDHLANSSIPAQVGLVIGKLSSSLDRGFVFDFVPTPLNDAGEPACSLIEPTKDDKKKGPKSKSQTDSSSLVIDKDWVAEHARQVSRMLLGGMKVIGIYVWVSDTAFKNSTMVLCQTIKGVAEAAPLSQIDGDERILIHICYSPRRWTCRNCSLASNITSSSLRPCDFKMGRVLTSLQTFRCMYNFDLRLPAYKRTSNVQTLIDVLHHGISVHAKQLEDAKAIIDGNLVLNDEPCISDGLHEVELFLPFVKDTSFEACSQKEVIGVVRFSGSVCSFAYLNSKEPMSQAVTDIKEDIILSLQSRLDIICDEADGEVPTDAESRESSDGMSAETPVHLLRKICNISFPRRVFVPWLAGTFVCDYLQSSETLEVLKDHFVELLSMEDMFDPSEILEPELQAPVVITKSFWDAAVPLELASNSSEEKNAHETSSRVKTVGSANINIVAAVIFLLLSILVGYVLIFVRKS
ncbi:hypothetical protein UlMin_036113 [Ulmus minor]